MSRKLRAMRDARERRRLEGVEPRYPRDLPALRRTLIIIDYDFGRVEHRIDLYRTPRIDCYRAVADGVEWKHRIGWSKVLAGLRVKFPAYALPDFRCRVLLTPRGRRKIATKAPSRAGSP
jgi:hypothetical protein